MDNAIQDPLLMTRAEIDAREQQASTDVSTEVANAMTSMVSNLTAGANTVDASQHRIFLIQCVKPYYASLLDEQNRRDIANAKSSSGQQQQSNNSSKGKNQQQQPHNPNHVLSVNHMQQPNIHPT